MDDATSEIYSAFLVEEDATASTFRALLEVFGRHGLPLSLYTDRGSHYFLMLEAGGPIDRKRPTQVGPALSHLSVEHIAAYSPNARGRSERLFQTLQDRLVKGTGVRRDRDGGGGEPVHSGGLSPGAQCPFHGENGAGGIGVRCHSWG